MIGTFSRVFDYADFEKKLRHYFADTAPIYAGIKLLMGEICVRGNKKYGSEILIRLDSRLGVKENIQKIIHCCEQSLYPKMLDLSEQTVELTEYQKKELLFQGYTLEQIHEKQIKKVWRRFIITRFNASRNSMDYKEENGGKIFRAHFNQPLAMIRDRLLRLSKAGQDGMRELYQFVINNAKIEELNNAVSENSV